MSENSKPEIVNCDFAFRCSKNWEAMQETNLASVRFCGECQKNVYFAQTNADLQSLSAEGKCVAVYEYNPIPDFSMTTAGMPVPPPRDFIYSQPPDRPMPWQMTAGLPVSPPPPEKRKGLLIPLIIAAAGLIVATLIITGL